MSLLFSFSFILFLPSFIPDVNDITFSVASWRTPPAQRAIPKARCSATTRWEQKIWKKIVFRNQYDLYCSSVQNMDLFCQSDIWDFLNLLLPRWPTLQYKTQICFAGIMELSRSSPIYLSPMWLDRWWMSSWSCQRWSNTKLHCLFVGKKWAIWDAFPQLDLKGGTCCFADKNALKGTLLENIKHFRPSRSPFKIIKKLIHYLWTKQSMPHLIL